MSIRVLQILEVLPLGGRIPATVWVVGETHFWGGTLAGAEQTIKGFGEKLKTGPKRKRCSKWGQSEYKGQRPTLTCLSRGGVVVLHSEIPRK